MMGVTVAIECPPARGSGGLGQRQSDEEAGGLPMFYSNVVRFLSSVWANGEFFSSNPLPFGKVLILILAPASGSILANTS
jgi:hypothetical protein